MSFRITENDIGRFAKKVGHGNGWRLMTCREANLQKSPIAIVTLNPGEKRQPPPHWSMEDSSISYFENEPWERAFAGKQKPGFAPLQIQVQLLARLLKIDLRETFTAQLVPFCSRDWNRLTNKQLTLQFCRILWGQLLQEMKATTVVAIGKGVATELAKLCHGKHVADFPIANWKPQTISLYECDDGRIVVGLPHLSRFRIFGRKDSVVAEEAFLKAMQQAKRLR